MAWDGRPSQGSEIQLVLCTPVRFLATRSEPRTGVRLICRWEERIFTVGGRTRAPRSGARTEAASTSALGAGAIPKWQRERVQRVAWGGLQGACLAAPPACHWTAPCRQFKKALKVPSRELECACPSGWDKQQFAGAACVCRGASAGSLGEGPTIAKPRTKRECLLKERRLLQIWPLCPCLCFPVCGHGCYFMHLKKCT